MKYNITTCRFVFALQLFWLAVKKKKGRFSQMITAVWTDRRNLCRVWFIIFVCVGEGILNFITWYIKSIEKTFIFQRLSSNHQLCLNPTCSVCLRFLFFFCRASLLLETHRFETSCCSTSCSLLQTCVSSMWFGPTGEMKCTLKLKVLSCAQWTQ